MLYHSFTVTDFLKAENPVDFLGKASEVSFFCLCVCVGGEEL